MKQLTNERNIAFLPGTLVFVCFQGVHHYLGGIKDQYVSIRCKKSGESCNRFLPGKLCSWGAKMKKLLHTLSHYFASFFLHRKSEEIESRLKKIWSDSNNLQMSKSLVHLNQYQTLAMCSVREVVTKFVSLLSNCVNLSTQKYFEFNAYIIRSVLGLTRKPSSLVRLGVRSVRACQPTTTPHAPHFFPRKRLLPGETV